MSGREALIRAVVESPDDDAPRLAYTDWLDREGETERAEFIRVQCTLAAMPADDPRRPALKAREGVLLGLHAWTWAEEFGTEISEWTFRRGFIERIGTSLERPADEILGLLNRGPIRHVRDTNQFCEFDGVVTALPSLERLTGLEFWNLYAFSNRLVAKLLASPFLRNLRTLILHHDRNGNLVKDKVLVKALASPHRARLRELAVNVDDMWRGPSEAVLRAMAGSPHLARLRRLCLSDTELTEDLVRTLGTSPAFANLTALDLGRCRLPPRVWEVVLKEPWLPRLERLRLSGAALIDARGYTTAVLKDEPKYRGRFDSLVKAVDWDSEFIDPYYRNANWRGYTWKERRRSPLVAMNGLIRAGDAERLEDAYRRFCHGQDGAEARAEIDVLPFDEYEASLRDGLRRALDVAPNVGGKAIYLRLHSDGDWGAAFFIHESPPAYREDEVPEEFSIHGPFVEIEGPTLPDASRIYERHPLHQGVRPNGPALFLLARTIAALMRALSRFDPPIPVYFSCFDAVFRIDRPRGSANA